MKIAWFTPFCEKSAIGRYNQILTNELSKQIDIDLWLSDNKELLFTDLKKIFYNSNDNLKSKLIKYDLIVYNLGNYLSFHKDIYEVSQKYRGIVILHDFVLHHFFADYYLNCKKDKEGYLDGIKKYYGSKVRKIADDGISGKRKPIWETEDVFKYPFFEKVIENSQGVIACSNFLAKKIKYKLFRPVKAIYNPFYSNDKLILRKKTSKKDLGLPENKLVLATVGHVISTKKIEIIIKILGKNKNLAEKVNYLILGAEVDKQYSSYLKSLVKKYKLIKVIKFFGYLEDNSLHDYESVTDIFINLRFPFTGGASWSVIEEMNFAKPVIVSDTGFFSELPNDGVVKISSGKEEESLSICLKKLINNEKVRIKIGENGKNFAIKNFRADIYSKKFKKFADKILFIKKFFNYIIPTNFHRN